jgi:hypothetical protein
VLKPIVVVVIKIGVKVVADTPGRDDVAEVGRGMKVVGGEVGWVTG